MNAMTELTQALGNSETIVAATFPGSLPMGGSVPDSPVFSLVNAPQQLRFERGLDLHPSRTDFDLDGKIGFLIDNVLTREEADIFVAVTEHFGYRNDAPGIHTPPGMRMNKSVHWVSDDHLLGAIYERISHLLPAEIDGKALHSRLSHRINMYRYDKSDAFNLHLDGDWPGYGMDSGGAQMVEWSGLHSKLTMLLYLNGEEDGVAGGTTRLYATGGKVVEVTPRKGAALFFRHGINVDSVLHEGSTVLGDVAKYVARINVLYDK